MWGGGLWFCPDVLVVGDCGGTISVFIPLVFVSRYAFFSTVSQVCVQLKMTGSSNDNSHDNAEGSSGRSDGRWVSYARLLRMLDRFAGDSAETSATIYLTAEGLRKGDGVPDEWKRQLEIVGPAARDSGCGMIGLRRGDRGLLVAPPFPVTETTTAADWHDGPLRRLLTAEFTVGVVLVRLGRYSVAVYKGSQLVSSKTDSRYVKGKHHAGGTSQLRYQRVREGQMRRLFDKVCEQVRTRLTPLASELDYLALGGDRFTLNGLLKVCPALEKFQDITLPRRLNIRDPKRDTLEDVGMMLRESRIWPVGW